MVVFYGSQTGTAEDFAQRIAKQAKRYGISAAVCDPEECDMVNRTMTWVFKNLFIGSSRLLFQGRTSTFHNH